jgi:hypothetical protein
MLLFSARSFSFSTCCSFSLIGSIEADFVRSRRSHLETMLWLIDSGYWFGGKDDWTMAIDWLHWLLGCFQLICCTVKASGCAMLVWWRPEEFGLGDCYTGTSTWDCSDFPPEKWHRTPNNPGSTAFGVHRTKPNVSEDLLMDLKCQDLRESWNNKRISERLPISRSLKDTYTNSKLSHISVFCVVEGQLHLCRQIQEGPLRVLDLVSMIESHCIASFSVNRFGVISTAKWNMAYLLESIVDG